MIEEGESAGNPYRYRTRTTGSTYTRLIMSPVKELVGGVLCGRGPPSTSRPSTSSGRAAAAMHAEKSTCKTRENACGLC